MENLGIEEKFWKDRSVFITGHTGFKGSWLSLWLNKLGAKVHGFSLAPPTSPNLFTEAKIETILETSTFDNIANFENLLTSIRKSKASIIFHLAAQPLVRASYINPVETFSTNIMGTINVLEAVSKCDFVEAVINITTDKCYANNEWDWPYREIDRLGGHDPYSSSKACVELISESYLKSFFEKQDIKLATVRAGNVIGGGDWADDRLIPDFFRSLDSLKVFHVRAPNSIRPWQHVLEPLSGYLLLAQKLTIEGAKYNGSWNFGPQFDDSKSVEWIVNWLCLRNPEIKWIKSNDLELHESKTLRVDSSKAKTLLGWNQNWSLEDALNATMEWHKSWKNNLPMNEFTSNQIDNFINKKEKKWKN